MSHEVAAAEQAPGFTAESRPPAVRSRVIRYLRGMPEPPGDHATRRRVGRWGEDWALWYFAKSRRARLIDRNFAGDGFEVDLMVQEGGTLVFVEVKVRSAANPEPLIEAQRPLRRARLSAAARVWLSRLRPPLPLLRFDVLLVTPDPANPLSPVLHHYGDCWRPKWDARRPTALSRA